MQGWAQWTRDKCEEGRWAIHIFWITSKNICQEMHPSLFHLKLDMQWGFIHSIITYLVHYIHEQKCLDTAPSKMQQKDKVCMVEADHHLLVRELDDGTNFLYLNVLLHSTMMVMIMAVFADVICCMLRWYQAFRWWCYIVKRINLETLGEL